LFPFVCSGIHPATTQKQLRPTAGKTYRQKAQRKKKAKVERKREKRENMPQFVTI
jgi:hypothetical protein